MPQERETFLNDGVALFTSVISLPEIEFFRTAFDTWGLQGPGKRQQKLPGNLIAQLADHPKLQALSKDLIGPSARLVRVIAFDKTPDINWGVPWHQDRTIAVKEKHETEGFGPWSKKDGAVHVEPPTSLLEGMVTLRLHLDDCHVGNGPLEVVPGSHRLGRVSQADVITEARMRGGSICKTDAGDILAMRALTIHRSQKATNPSRRRILHLEYAAEDLPSGLEWLQS